MSEWLSIAVPLGIGDNFWIACKLDALKKQTGKKIRLYINQSPWHDSVHFLRLLPMVDDAVTHPKAPYHLDRALGNYNDPRWSTLAGSADWNGFDYLLCPLPHLERGEPLSTWLPELETNYHPEIRLTKPKEPGRVLLYPSGMQANGGFHGGWWQPEWWATIVRTLNLFKIVPTYVGANTESDLEYFKLIPKTGDFENLVGQTSVEEYLTLIRDARVWIGLNSGGGIVSVGLRTPTVMLWSDRTYKTRAGGLHPNQQRSWVQEPADYYQTLSYGAPNCTPAEIVGAALGVMRCS